MKLEISNIEFPYELVESLRKGDLVVFVGAGASFDSPSSLPSFEALAYQVGAYNGHIPANNDVPSTFRDTLKEKPIPSYLEDLHERKHIKVHSIVSKILGNPSSKPNDWHKAIIELFPDLQNLRIVTTNFDTHLSASLSQKMDEYIAPALPTGDSFKGIVYLHGNLTKPAEEIILTDRDFSKAYLKYGRQTAFLRELFSSHPVLFVGYSHNDIILNYIAKSDSFSQKRYILTDSTYHSYWESLGIIPIYYTAQDHPNCLASLKILGGLIRRSALAEEDEIKRIVAKKPLDITLPQSDELDDFLDEPDQSSDAVISSEVLPDTLSSEESSYLKWILNKPASVRKFTEHADQIEWLIWAEQNGYLKPLFSPEPLDEDAQKIRNIFAFWFASENFIKNYTDLCLKIIATYGSRSITPLLNSYIALTIFRMKELPDSPDFAKWVHILCESYTGTHNDQLTYLLGKCRFPQDKYIALSLFDFLSKPRFLFKKGFRGEVSPEIIFYGDDHWLRDFREKTLLENLSVVKDRLKGIVLAHLHSIYEMEASIGKANESWDRLSYRRSAIEDHSQDNHNHDVDHLLITLARDIIEHEIATDQAVGIGTCFSLFASEVPILKRLAIHGIRLSSLPPNKKLKFLLQNDLLYSSYKHEVFLLLKELCPQLEVKDKAELLKRVQKGSGNPKRSDRSAQYEIFNLLHWLNLADPSCKSTADALKQIHEENPDFGKREHPDFDHWMESGWGGISPASTEEILLKNPEDEQFIQWIVSFQDQGINRPDRSGLLQGIKVAVGADIDWGLKLARALIAKSIFEQDIWDYVLWGWREAKLDEGAWKKIFDLLHENPRVYETSYYNISDLFQKGMRKGENCVPESLIQSAVELALNVTKVAFTKEETPSIHGDTDWLSRSINSTGGHICEGLVFTFERLKGNLTPEQITTTLDSYFRIFLDNRNYTADMGCVILGRCLYYFFCWNADWTQKNIVPLFRWSNDAALAEKVWHGYMYDRKWNNSLYPILVDLHKEFIELHTEAAPFLNSRDSLRDAYAEHIAGISIFSVVLKLGDPLQEEWIIDFVRKASEEERLRFTNQIELFLRDNEEIKSNIHLVWTAYLKPYWELRSLGKPVPLTQKEIKSLIEWLPFLGEHFPEGVQFVLGISEDLLAFQGYQHTDIYRYLSESPLLQSHTNDAGLLIRHLVKNKALNPYYFKDVHECVAAIKAHNVDGTILQDICAYLSEAGDSEAREYLPH